MTMREAFVEEVAFPAASLEGADLTSAHLEGAALAGARANEGTRWPDGFDWQIAGVVIAAGE
jgi:uncharacterized protein YjbI with pentapeptide repeats